MTNYSIIGVDGFTSGLAKLFSLMPANEETNLCIFSSNTKKIGTRLYGYTIQEFSSEGLEYMDVIILAIPANQVIKFSIRHQRLFSQKIIVDCSNKLGNGVELQQKLPNSHVVKTLTSINLYTIRDPNYTPRPQGFMPLAGENQQALNIISDMLKYLGYQPQAYASIEFSRYMEHANLKNFPHWTFPITVGGSLVTIFSAYAIVDRNIAYGNPWYGQSIQTLNAGVSCAALALFSLTYSIGPLALIKQRLSKRILTEHQDPYLVDMLARRKQFGLVAMVLLFEHAVLSSMLFSSTYFSYFSIENSSGESALSNAAMLSLSAGVTAFGLDTMVAISSLPNVQLGWKEWRTIQYYVGWLALLLAAAHVFFMGYDDLMTESENGYTWPSLFFAALVFPMLAVAMKTTSLMVDSIYDLRHCSSRLLSKVGLFSSDTTVSVEVIEEDDESQERELLVNDI